MADLTVEALSKGRAVEGEGAMAIVQHFVRNEERFFRPRPSDPRFPERADGGSADPAGHHPAAQEDEMKRGVVETVSHQLKTPLTSIRMALHLMLEEKVGGITPKQSDLLVAASEDADRLHDIIEKLLDIGHLESGRVQLDLRSVSPKEIISMEAEPYRNTARDGGVTLSLDLPVDLPDVWVDPARIELVFSDLLSNALKYTSPGGSVSLTAKEEGGLRAICRHRYRRGHSRAVPFQDFRSVLPGSRAGTGDG